MVLWLILRGDLLRDRLVSLPYMKRSVSEAAKSYGQPVKVEEGEFFYQNGERRTVPAYDIDPVEVTIAQYAEFLAAVGSSTEYDHAAQPANKGAILTRSGSNFMRRP